MRAWLLGVLGCGAGGEAQLLTTLPCRGAGSFDRFLNVQISFIILLQILMCAVHGSLSLWWRNTYGIDHYYLALDVQGQVRGRGRGHRQCPGVRSGMR